MTQPNQGLSILTIQFQLSDLQGPPNQSDASQLIQKLNRLQQQIKSVADATNAANQAASAASTMIKYGNPTALVGLIPKNGTLTTVLRSDSAPAIDQTIQPTWTGTHTWSFPAIGTGQTDAIVITNTYPATSAQQQFSPRLRMTGQGWTGIASQARSFAQQVRPVGTNSVLWVVSAQVGSTGFFDVFAVDQLGNITLASWNGNTIAADYGGTGNDVYVVGDMLYASAVAELTRLAAPTDNNLNVLTSQSIAGVPQPPAWADITTLVQQNIPPNLIPDDSNGPEESMLPMPGAQGPQGDQGLAGPNGEDGADADQILQLLELNNPLVVNNQLTATSATGGAASALPSTPAGYIEVVVNGTLVKLPYYNP